MTDPPPPPDGTLGRRDALLDGAIAATASVAAAATAWPIARFVAPAEDASDAPRAVVGRRADFAPGTVKLVRKGVLPVLVVADESGALRAFDARCTHLGCTVGYDRAARQIACRCHGGRFALDGRVLEGPAPTALRALTVEAVGDDVVVEEAPR